MLKKTAIVLTLFSLVGCASYNGKFNQVHGGDVRPVAYVYTMDKTKVINKINEFCDRNNYEIDTATANSVVCSREAPMMLQAFLGTRSGTAVRQQFKYNIIPVNDKIKITVRSTAGNQTAFGQNKSMDIESADGNKDFQRVLNIIKNEVEQGK